MLQLLVSMLLIILFYGQSISMQNNHKVTTITQNTQRAYFAGGCFWCMEAAFDHVQGVLETNSGFMGGHVPNPNYKQVSSGTTGHRETVEVIYDPSQVTYGQLLDTFWKNIDPLDGDGQFSDRGHQYTSAVYTLNDQQKETSERSKLKIEKQLGQPVKTGIAPANTFYKAEDYHQNYHVKNPLRYSFFKSLSGRPTRLKALWGK